MNLDSDKENIKNPSLAHESSSFMSHLRLSGMEYEKSTLNGIYDDVDEAELDAAAKQSELSRPTNMTPLHVQVNGFNGSGSEPSSISSGQRGISAESSSYLAAMKQKAFNKSKEYQFQRPSTSTAPIMGPPSSSSSVMLSPAGALNGNGFSRNSGDSSPNPAFQQPSRQYLKRPPQYQPAPSTPSPSSGQSSSGSIPKSPATQRMGNIPKETVRKDIEVGQRKALCDAIRKLRDEKQINTFIPQIDGQTETQCAIMMRRNRTEIGKTMPTVIKNEVFGEKGDEFADSRKTAALLRENAVLRFRVCEPDDLTDISEDEEDESVISKARRKELMAMKIPQNKLIWNENKLRLSGQMAKTSLLIQEKLAKLELLEMEISAMNMSSGVRFEGEELIPRKRRLIDGKIHLFDKKNSLDRGTDSEKYGCSRARPIISWTKNALTKNVFEPEKCDYNKPCGSNWSSLQQLPQHYHNQVTVGARNVITKLTSGNTDQRETREFEYESHEEGKGAVGVKAVTELDVMDYVVPKDFQSLETRLLSYFYNLSCTPSLVYRRSRDRSIYFSAGAEEKHRNGVDRSAAGQKGDRVKEIRDRDRKRKNDDDLSDEDDEKDGNLNGKNGQNKKNGQKNKRRPANRVGKKTIRNRPAGVSSRQSTSTTRSRPDFDDYYFDEPFSAPLPPKIAYARIYIPKWEEVAPDYWLKFPQKPSESAASAATTPCSSSTNSPAIKEPMWMTVAQDHHKLMYVERERVKRELAKKNRQFGTRQRLVGSLTPCEKPSDDVFSMEEDVILQNLPPFDPKIFANEELSPTRRRFANKESPFEKRTFSLISNGKKP
ncbi:unnamed protein product [Caenorhabditis angaria]|uniref:Uncharacterized protein n=1 Tax=Caenorhabditis angaria TaxID=860376 RepID=A0A9P1N042_9PELO|nr:unnamed protein product [Caenorhabditis angaria]